MNFGTKLKMFAVGKMTIFISAVIAELKAQKEVIALFKSEIKTNMIDAFKSGKLKEDIKTTLKDFKNVESYQIGILPQDLNNEFTITKYHDYSKNMVGGNKYRFNRKYRWHTHVVPTKLLRKLGKVDAKPEPVKVDGVNFPPRFKRDLENKHYMLYRADSV